MHEIERNTQTHSHTQSETERERREIERPEETLMTRGPEEEDGDEDAAPPP